MKKAMKKEIVILGVIILLLFGYLLFRSTDRMQYKIPELEDLQADGLDKILIQEPDRKLELVKKDGKWLIRPNDYLADGGKMDSIVKAVSQLTLTDLVSRSKNYVRYDLQEGKAIVVTVYKGEKEVRRFDIGKPAATHGHTFVRLAGDDNVYYARESFRTHFEVKSEELRDKVVLKLDTNEISGLEIQSEGQAVQFAKNLGAAPSPLAGGEAGQGESQSQDSVSWITPEGKKGKMSDVDGLIGQFSQLSCEEYVAGKTRADYKDMKPIYSVKLKGSKDYVLRIFAAPEKKEGEAAAPGGDKYPALSSESDYPFWLSSWKAQQIMKKPAELLEEEKKDDKK